MYATRNFKEEAGVRNPLPWILIGGVLAPIVMFLMSWLSDNPQLRSLTAILLIPIAGALLGWGIYASTPVGHPRGFQKSIWLIVTLIVYVMVLLFGYSLAEVASIY